MYGHLYRRKSLWAIFVLMIAVLATGMIEVANAGDASLSDTFSPYTDLTRTDTDRWRSAIYQLHTIF